MKTVEEMLDIFTKVAETFRLTDPEGNPMKIVEAGKTVVHGPFRLVTKDQIARVIGIVTESMLNADGTDDKGQSTGERVYRFQGNGWEPQASVGDVLLQDVNNPADRWACKPDLFGGTGWVGTVQNDLTVTYAKPGKPLLALDLPKGTVVVSKEGPRKIDVDGCILAVTKPNKGDFYVWTPDVVQKYVRPYRA